MALILHRGGKGNQAELLRETKAGRLLLEELLLETKRIKLANYVAIDEDLDEDEKKVRQQGIFVPKGGFVLKEFDMTRHIIAASESIPRLWSIYVSIDHGLNNPTAIMWHAVSPSGSVITFKEHYMRKWIISKHVNRIKEINATIWNI